MEALEACVQKLDPASRELVEEIYTRGSEVTALALRQSSPVQTLYNKLGFIRRALAECVERTMAGAAS